MKSNIGLHYEYSDAANPGRSVFTLQIPVKIDADCVYVIKKNCSLLTVLVKCYYNWKESSLSSLVSHFTCVICFTLDFVLFAFRIHREYMINVRMSVARRFSRNWHSISVLSFVFNLLNGIFFFSFIFTFFVFIVCFWCVAKRVQCS